jgi:predicted RNase H-like nuclease (RuvC/YqgF family)
MIRVQGLPRRRARTITDELDFIPLDGLEDYSSQLESEIGELSERLREAKRGSTLPDRAYVHVIERGIEEMFASFRDLKLERKRWAKESAEVKALKEEIGGLKKRIAEETRERESLLVQLKEMNDKDLNGA